MLAHALLLASLLAASPPDTIPPPDASLAAALPEPELVRAPQLTLGPGYDADRDDLDEPEGPEQRSVYQVGRADLGLTLLAAAGAIVPNRFPRQLTFRSCPCLPSEVNGFDRFAIDLHSKAADLTSDATVLLAIAVPMIADTIRLGFTPVLGEDVLVMAQSVAVNAAIVTAVKYLVQRPLPATYANRDGLQEQAQGFRSFYSGHTSTAFAALATAAWTIHLRDGPKVWPWVVTGLVGASVGVERVLAGRHFPTDVLVGAAAGLAVGTLVPLLHARVPPWGRGTLSLVPAGRGLALSGSF
jgi:membrane-associated phospholipid phosphatase